MNSRYIVVCVFAIFAMLGCSLFNKKPITPLSRKNFNKTELKKAAKLVEKQKILELQALLDKFPDYVDQQEPRFKQTLLHWACSRGLYFSAKTLIDRGADPNVQARDRTHSVIQASKVDDPKLLKMLIDSEGDPNLVAKPESYNKYQKYRTPIITAAFTSLQNVKVLVEAGADIDYTEYKYGIQNALVSAFKAEKMDIVKYLIMEKKIDLDNLVHVNMQGDSVEVRTYLRNLTFPLESDDYKVKMEIVSYLQARKINYWEYPVPRKLYLNFKPKYLKQY